MKDETGTGEVIFDKKPQNLCADCRNDFYNQPGNSNTGQCWLLKSAKVVTRYKTPWWTRPTEPGAFTKVMTFNCHHEPGRFSFRETLPDFITADERKRIEAQ